MRVPFGVLLLLSFLIRSSCAADRVSVLDGRIVLENFSGQKTTLTQSGFDSDPWISPDGGTVVFLRRPPGGLFNASVYKIDLRTGTTKLLYAGPARYHGRESSNFGRPELDASHKTLFLLSREYATSGALLSIRLANFRATLISDEVVGYDVIECPKKYRGDLLVLKRHEEDILGRPYFLYQLYSASGRPLGLAGGGELDEELDSIRSGGCEEPDAMPPI